MTVFDHLSLGHILFSLTFCSGHVTRHLPSALHRWCISWFILVLLWTTWSFVVFFSQYQVVWGNLTRPLLIFSACCYRELCEVIKTYPFVNFIFQLYWGKRDIVSTVLLWTNYLNNVWISADDEICLSSQFSVSSFWWTWDVITRSDSLQYIICIWYHHSRIKRWLSPMDFVKQRDPYLL